MKKVFEWLHLLALCCFLAVTVVRNHPQESASSSLTFGVPDRTGRQLDEKVATPVINGNAKSKNKNEASAKLDLKERSAATTKIQQHEEVTRLDKNKKIRSSNRDQQKRKIIKNNKNNKNNNKEKRYLLYVAHSGYSNQLFALKRAAQLARDSQRVLVVPPILPHHGMFAAAAVVAKNGNKDEQEYHKLFGKAVALGRPAVHCLPQERVAKMQRVMRQVRVLERLLKWNADKNNENNYRMQNNKTKDNKIINDNNSSISPSSWSSFYYSHSQLMDFTAISRATGVEFVDLVDFVRQIMMQQHDMDNLKSRSGSSGGNLLFTSWFMGKNAQMDYTGACSSGNKTVASAQSVLDRFRQNFGNTPVALMHSPFILNPLDPEPTSGRLMTDNILTFPLASPLKRLVTYLVQQQKKQQQSQRGSYMPGYMGLHIRFQDRANLANCTSDPRHVKRYQQAFDELAGLVLVQLRDRLKLKNGTLEQRKNRLLVTNNKNSSSNGNSRTISISLLIGLSNKHSKKCFDELSESLWLNWQRENNKNNITAAMPSLLSFDTFTVNDLLSNSDDTARSLVDQIHMDRGTLHLVLDQILLGMAPLGTAMASYMADKDGGFKGSTFQQVVELRQNMMKKKQSKPM